MTNAERVRNNQRRSRARRKEYIAELESKLQQYQCSCGRSPSNTRLEELGMELNSLKRLLHSLGLKDEFLEAYTGAARLAPTLALGQEITIGTNDPSPSTSYSAIISPSSNYEAGLVSTSHPLENFTPPEAALPWDLFRPLASPTPVSEPVEVSNMSVPSEDYHESISLASPGFEASTTTLCTTAFSLVLESNRKGYNPTDLDLKLRVGYRFSATPLEGCRVDNHVLMEVLADIS
jgi:hypothetical protein